MNRLIVLAGIGLLALAPCNQAVAAATGAEAADSAQDYLAAIRDWREQRNQRLSRADGWLTLVGLEWLQEGENRVGADADNDARIPGGPAHWGTVAVDGDLIIFEPNPEAGIAVDGEAVDGDVPLVADIQGTPTVVSSGRFSFHVIFRESYALRIKDSQAPTRVSFTGVDCYEIQPDWRIEGRMVRAAAGTTIEIGNVLGQLNPMPVYGTFEFEQGGGKYSLLALGSEDSDSLWFLFADRTTGKETYGAGRFLYSDGMPENGRLVVDFNKAYNPPCAFNDYSTCPLPPQQNRLNLAVTAGEKDFHHD